MVRSLWPHIFTGGALRTGSLELSVRLRRAHPVGGRGDRGAETAARPLEGLDKLVNARSVDVRNHFSSAFQEHVRPLLAKSHAIDALDGRASQLATVEQAIHQEVLQIFVLLVA